MVLTGSPSIREGDLWDAETPQQRRCLLSARLFPVLHACEALGLEDVLWLLAPAAAVASDQLARWRAAWRMSWQELLPCLDKAAELDARQALFFLQGQRKVRRVLLGHQDSSLLPLTRSAVHEGYHEAMLGTLDEGELDSCKLFLASLGIGAVWCSPLHCKGCTPRASNELGWAQTMRVLLLWGQGIAEAGWSGVTCSLAGALQPPSLFQLPPQPVTLALRHGHSPASRKSWAAWHKGKGVCGAGPLPTGSGPQLLGVWRAGTSPAVSGSWLLSGRSG